MRLLLIAALCAVGFTAPVSGVEDARSGFRIKQEKIKLGYMRSGTHLTANVYRKFGKQMPSDVEAAAATVTGTVVATPEDEYDDAYLSPVSIGGQTLQLDFDTGSADLWVFSSSLPSSNQTGHSIYNPALSSTAKVKSGYSWSITYGDGSSASGTVYTDTVDVGGATVTSQAVELATRLSAAFTQDQDLDGLLGLAFNTINRVSPTPQKTFFDNIKSSLTSPIFTVDLKYHAAGSYDFGYIDSAKMTGTVSYVNVNTANGFWEFTSNGYAIGSGSFVTSSIDTIADTGTTLLYLPMAVVKAYYAKVTGSSYSSSYGGFIYPCPTTLPSITLGVGSYKAVVPGTYIKYGPVNTGSTTCYGGIQPNIGIGFSIFGDIFFKSQFVIFSGALIPQLGLAPKATTLAETGYPLEIEEIDVTKRSD
ncbi:MAG: Type I transmembrane sorting receptor [Stictis urceolatum]|nr:Type I transmembrane sorting receptor [Stictis urceolata]